MGFTLSKALSAYERMDEVSIDCGGWSVRLRSFSSLTEIIRKKLAQQRSKMKVETTRKLNKALPSANKAGLVEDDPASSTLFGSEEADIQFFCEHAIVGWTGLMDDGGNEIPFSVENALMLFLEQGEAGKRLYHELANASTDDTLFMMTKDVVTAEDEKNS